MPIKITCKACNAVLRAPDTAAGKKIKCPKCSAAIAVPAAAAEVEAHAANSTPSHRQRENDTPGASNGEDRARRRRRSKASARSTNRLLLGLGVGVFALLLLGVGGFIVLRMSESEPAVADAGKKAKPATPVKPTEQTKVQEPEEPIQVPQVSNPARAPEKTAARNKLRQIGIAIQSLTAEPGKHFMATAGGRPDGLSWRVLLLPEIGQLPLFRQFKLEEPWNSEHNLKVLKDNGMPSIYTAERSTPGDDRERKTYLQLFTGPGTCFPTPDARLKMNALARGPSNTWLMAEAMTSIEWTRPDELQVKDGQLPALGGVYAGDFFVLCADGNSHYVYANQFPAVDILALISTSNTAAVKGWPPE